MSPPASYRRILISRMKFIGDVVLTTPVIRSLRGAFPSAYIAYMADAQASCLLEQNPCLDEIIAFDFTRPAWREQLRVASLLRRRRFDLAIDLFGNPRSALLTYLSGAQTRVGLDRPGRGRLFTVRVRDAAGPKTAIAFYMQFLRAIGVPQTSARTEIFLTDDERAVARRLLAGVIEGSRPVVGLHPGATWPAKRWLPERFAEVAGEVRERLGAEVILTAGPNDQEVVRAVQQGLKTPLPVFADLPLRGLAALLGQCAAYVANDSGPMHIAVAVDTPTIGIFGPGEENIWFPYASEDGNVALRHDVPCHPCHLDFCDRKEAAFMQCMKGLRREVVVAAIEGALRHRPRPVA
jgi:lipopolysaccharide heptosyltransferase II